jgi:hypothetical protein
LKTRQIELSNVDPASERMQLETLPLATGNSRELFPDLRGILPAP